jgi:hypothetical protein
MMMTMKMKMMRMMIIIIIIIMCNVTSIVEIFGRSLVSFFFGILRKKEDFFLGFHSFFCSDSSYCYARE